MNKARGEGPDYEGLKMQLTAEREEVEAKVKQ
jgi:hypothetical protein